MVKSAFLCLTTEKVSAGFAGPVGVPSQGISPCQAKSQPVPGVLRRSQGVSTRRRAVARVQIALHRRPELQGEGAGPVWSHGT